MIWLHSSLLFLCTTLVVVSYADLIEDLDEVLQNITILSPGMAAFTNASRAYNRRFVIEPAAIIYPNTAQDVSAALIIAQRYNCSVAARSGGHSYIANGLGGKNGSLVIDMSNFVQLSVDPGTYIATIGPGNRLGDVALGLDKTGRALPHGTCPYVGFGGHAIYGGYGFTSRMWGLTLDTIQSLEVVLANGTIVNATASDTETESLFFAMRGAGGSFGIVTSFQVKTFPAPSSATYFKYTWDFSVADAANATQQFQTFVQTNISQEFGAELVLGKGSSIGNVSFTLTGGWYGPAGQFDGVIQPLLAAFPRNASSESIKPGTYINSVELLGGKDSLNTTTAPDAHDTFDAKSLMTPLISGQAINAFISYLAIIGFQTDLKWFVQIELYGGTNSAINNVANNVTAFYNRKSTFTIQFYASKPESSSSFPSEGYSFLDKMVSSIVLNQPSNWTYGAYANYPDERLDNWQSLYYGTSFLALEYIKGLYDRNNTFDSPLSIPPFVLT